jgi:hypothetical protein
LKIGHCERKMKEKDEEKKFAPEKSSFRHYDE